MNKNRVITVLTARAIPVPRPQPRSGVVPRRPRLSAVHRLRVRFRRAVPNLAARGCLALALLTMPFTLLAEQRVVTIGGDVTEIAFALGDSAEVVARDSTSLQPADQVRRLPDVGYLRQLNAEGIIASAPDMVLLTADGVKTLGGEEKVWQLPGLAMTPAGKHHRLLVLDDMALLGFGLDTPAAIVKLRTAAARQP